ncbi:hypothetical protein WJX72_004589 [[Myrmecia] bisecta]|uniref:Major facilitator superfamily (MFS) profile domain-containing protein n=1 Tax=[Myrmecia] bisecta TaxID=41462 RepID=A0AAW1PWT4_9CHLO
MGKPANGPDATQDRAWTGHSHSTAVKPRQPGGISWDLWLVYLNVTLYATCYMAQVPVLPYLIKSLGADAAAYGTLQTVFSTVQLFGGLVSGPLIDRFGARAVFIVSFASSALSYGLTARADTMLLLYASRLPTVFQHAVLGARAYVTARSSEKDRARLLGYVGVAYGIGFAVGPYVGGLLSAHSLQLAAWVATGGSLLSVALILLFLPRDMEAAKPHADVEASRAAPKAKLSDIVTVCGLPGVPSLLVVKVLTGLAFAIFHSTFTLILVDQFGLEAKDNGLVLSYVGVASIVVQAVVVGWVSQRFPDSRVVKASLAGLLLSFGLLAATMRVWQLLLVLLPLSATGILISTINTAQLTKAVPAGQRGTVIAVDMSIGSGVRVLSPTLGTWLLTTFSFPSIGGSSAVLVALLLLLIQLQYIECAPHARKVE